MRKLAFITPLAISLFITAPHASGQQNPTWLNKEFLAPVVPVQSVESFINDSCGPSGLDGIQVLSIQAGHNENIHLHIYCRQDKVASGHYKITMVPDPNRNLDEVVMPVVGNTKFRVGTFYLGRTSEPNAVLLIEKTH
jgi:hypothetical protein